MKQSCLYLVALGLAMGGPPALSQDQLPDIRLGLSVASPTRTQSSALANATKPAVDRYLRHRRDDQDALVWVDVTGKTVGRFASDTTMVVPFNGQQALIRGMAIRRCVSGCSEPLLPAVWGPGVDFPLLFASSDCTGQAYTTENTAATPYVGTPAVDRGTTYIYFFRLAAMSTVVVNSRFSASQCRAVFPGESTRVAPAAAFLPASALGTEPFAVK
jgi:hypothetical protein